MSYAEAARDEAWDYTISAGKPYTTVLEEWSADYYAHFGATDRIGLYDIKTELSAAHATVAAYRVTFDGHMLKRSDIVDVLAFALKQAKPKITVFTMASNATKAFDCKGTLWRDANCSGGGGFGLITDTICTGVTRVNIVVKVKDSEGEVQDVPFSFEMSRDEIAVSHEVTDVGILTDTFYHKRFNWIRRNETLCAMIGDGCEDVTVGLVFSNGNLLVKAAGPVKEIAKLMTALGNGWRIQWNGGDRLLKIGSVDEVDEAKAGRQEFIKQRNADEDADNGIRKLKLLGMPAALHQSEEAAQAARAVCETFCVEGSIDDFGIKADKNGDSFMWIRFTHETDAFEAAKNHVGLGIKLVNAGVCEKFPKVMVAKAVRDEKPKKALVGSGVQELGDLQQPKALSVESWMLDVARVHKAKPTIVRSAMVPFQDAAQRGTALAIKDMAAEATKAYNATMDMSKKLSRVHSSQDSMLSAINELSEGLRLDREERAQQRADERYEGSQAARAFNNGTQPATQQKPRQAPASAKRRSSEQRPQQDMDDDDDSDGEEGRGQPRSRRETPKRAPRADERSAETGRALFMELAESMADSDGGRDALRRLADGNPEHARFLTDAGLLQ